jgi:hypothetical protein
MTLEEILLQVRERIGPKYGEKYQYYEQTAGPSTAALCDETARASAQNDNFYFNLLRHCLQAINYVDTA